MRYIAGYCFHFVLLGITRLFKLPLPPNPPYHQSCPLLFSTTRYTYSLSIRAEFTNTASFYAKLIMAHGFHWIPPASTRSSSWHTDFTESRPLLREAHHGTRISLNPARFYAKLIMAHGFHWIPPASTRSSSWHTDFTESRPLLREAHHGTRISLNPARFYAKLIMAHGFHWIPPASTRSSSWHTDFTESRPLLREALTKGTVLYTGYVHYQPYRLLPSPARMLPTAQSWTCTAASHFGFALFLSIFASSPCTSASRHFCAIFASSPCIFNPIRTLFFPIPFFMGNSLIIHISSFGREFSHYSYSLIWPFSP